MHFHFRYRTYLIPCLNLNTPNKPYQIPFLQTPLAESWDVINTGLKLEVVNTEAHLPTTVYWIASIVKLAGSIKKHHIF